MFSNVSENTIITIKNKIKNLKNKFTKKNKIKRLF